MAFRLKNMQVGQAFTASGTVLGVPVTQAIPAHKLPSPLSGRPFINDAYDTSTPVTADVSTLDTVTAWEWRVYPGGAVLSTDESPTGTTLGSGWVELETTSTEGVTVSPPMWIAPQSMMGMSMPSHHIMTEMNVLRIVAHSRTTHITITSGPWNDSATWEGGRVPKDGANVLVAHPHVVTYNNSLPHIMLDSLRVDGTLTWALDQDTELQAEHIITSGQSSFLVGDSFVNTIGDGFQANIKISGFDYDLGGIGPTDMDLVRDPQLLGRGIVTLGRFDIWGDDRPTWAKATAELEIGAETLTFDRDMPGVAVGTELIIGATDLNGSYVKGDPFPPLDQTEVVEVATVVDRTVTWVGGLTYRHGNPLAASGSPRHDIYPVIGVRNNKNVVIQSQYNANRWERGHIMVMHRSQPDLWNAAGISLGRTDKEIPTGAFDGVGGAFRYYDNAQSSYVERPKTARDNLQSRYTWHSHQPGFGRTNRPRYVSLYGEDSLGWMYVDHDGEIEMNANLGYLAKGAFFVAETGNETSEWADNVAMSTTNPGYDGGGDNNFNLAPKTQSSSVENFSEGIGFGFKGRQGLNDNNIAVGVNIGHWYWHRAPSSGAISPVEDPDRAYLDLKEQSLSRQGTIPAQATFQTFRRVNYPILHGSDFHAYAVFHGGDISKTAPQANHDTNARIQFFKSYGARTTGHAAEYVGVYNFWHSDVIASVNTLAGPSIAARGNTYQFTMVNGRSEGFDMVYDFRGGDGDNSSIVGGTGSTDDHDQVNFRYAAIGADDATGLMSDADKINGAVPSDAVKTFEDICLIDQDWDGSLINYDLTPSLSAFSNDIATWDGSLVTGVVTNPDLTKTDNGGSGCYIVEKLFGDKIFALTNGDYTAWAENRGYWDIGGTNYLLMPYVINDRLTNRPYKFIKRVVYTDPTPPVEYTDNGTFAWTDTPITCDASIQITTAAETPVVIDLLSEVTLGGGNGSGTYSLDIDDSDPYVGDFIKFNKGRTELSSADNTITFTPRRGFIGDDEGYFHIKSGNQYATVRVDVLVGGSGAGLTVPVVDTHFSIETGDASGQIKVNTLEKPGTDGARILTTYYKTAGASSRRRLCHGYPLTTTTISVDSDGAALTPGASVSVQLEYDVAYGRENSGLSFADTATAGS